MQKIRAIIITTLVVVFGFNMVNTVASARTLKAPDFGVGNEIELTQPTKVNYVSFGHDGIWGLYSKVTSSKTLPKGTILYGYYKGHDDVDACFYNPAIGVTLSHKHWPSLVLTTKNCKIVQKFNYVYGPQYTADKYLSLGRQSTDDKTLNLAR